MDKESRFYLLQRTRENVYFTNLEMMHKKNVKKVRFPKQVTYIKVLKNLILKIVLNEMY